MFQTRNVQKKHMWLLVILLTATLFLWGCGGGETTEPAAPAPAPAETPSETAETAEVPAETTVEEGQEMDEAQIAALFGGGQALDELHYEMTITGMGVGTTETSIWLKGERMRSESFVMGQHFIMIYDTDAVYTLDPGERTAMKLPFDMGMDETMDPITAEDLTADVEGDSLQYLGVEEYNGLMCPVVQSIEPDTGYGVKMWLHPDYGFPMKVESLSTDPEERFVMEVTNFRVGGVSDDLFVVPSDYEVIDFSDMLQNMPGMPVVPGT